MEQIKPFIKCVDFWPERIPPGKLAAYKALIEEGQIRKHTVIHERKSGSTTIEYYAIAPQEWIHDELRRRSNEV